MNILWTQVNILSSSIIMTRTYGVAQGLQLGKEKGYEARKQRITSLQQGASKIDAWDVYKGADLGVVAPLQYYRVPGDPDRALHRKAGSWYRLLGSEMASEEYRDPLGVTGGGMLNVTGGAYNLLSGTGAVNGSQSGEGLWSWLLGLVTPNTGSQAARNPGSRSIGQRRDQDEGELGQPQDYYFHRSHKRTAIGDVENPVREGFGDGTTTTAFDYGSTLVDAQSSLLNEVNEEDAAAQKLMLAYAEANSALIDRQNTYVKHTDDSFKYRNQFVNYDNDGKPAMGYVTHRGALRPVSAEVLPTIRGERGCPSLVAQGDVQKSFFFEGSPMAADEPCPPSGRNVEVMGASLAANNTSSWHEHCFADDTMVHQTDLPTNPRELVMASCHARAADVGASAYSVYNQDNEGDEFQCFITHKDYSELTENKESATIEVTTDDKPLISKEIGDEDDSGSYMATILNNGEFVLGPEGDIANASARMGTAVSGCDPKHGAPISVTQANLGTNCMDRDTCFLMDPTGAMCAEQLKKQAEAAQEEQDRVDAEVEQARLEAEAAAAAAEELESGPELLFLSKFDTCPDIDFQSAALNPRPIDLFGREEVRKTLATSANCAQWDGNLYKEKDRAGLYMGITGKPVVKEPVVEEPVVEEPAIEQLSEFAGREAQLLPLSTYDTCPGIAKNNAGEKISYVDLAQHKIGELATSGDCPEWDGTLYKDRNLKDLPGTVYMGVKATGTAPEEVLREQMSEFTGAYETDPSIIQSRCNAANPDWGTVKATKVNCAADACNSNLGGNGWLDMCNAEHPGWSCCAKDYRPS